METVSGAANGMCPSSTLAADGLGNMIQPVG